MISFQDWLGIRSCLAAWERCPHARHEWSQEGARLLVSPIQLPHRRLSWVVTLEVGERSSSYILSHPDHREVLRTLLRFERHNIFKEVLSE